MGRTFNDFVIDICDDIFIKTTDTDIPVVKRYINRAYKELAKRERIDKTVTVIASEYKFNRPTDYVKGYELYPSGVELPVQFWEEGSQIICGYNGEMEFIYNYEPVELSLTTDEPVTNPSNDQFIKDMVCYLWFSRENKKEYKAEIYKRNFENMPIKVQRKKLQWQVER